MNKNRNLSSTVGIAIVGAGYWGPNLIRNFNSIDDCKIQLVCDKRPGRLRYVHQKWPDISLTEHYDEVINDPKVDAVVIVTPVSTHYDLGLVALKAGKHVFIEKPLALDEGQAKAIVDLADQKELVIATGHTFVYHPAITAMKENINKDGIGRLCYAESGRVNLAPPASEVNVIWDLAVHDVSILLYLWGEDPVEVRAYGRNFRHRRLIDVAFLYLRFNDDSIAQHHVSWMSPEKVRRFFVAGTKGSLIFDDTAENGKLRIVDKGIDTRINQKDNEMKELYYKPGQIVTPKLTDDEPLRLECQHFLGCISCGTPSKADGHSGLAVVRVLEAAERSIELGGESVLLDKDRK